MTKLPPRLPIPNPTKLAVRQHDGFGCCKCGHTIFEYHHIIERIEKPEEIMLLCPNHHDEVTRGAMTLNDQWHYKKNPYNIQHSSASGKLIINQSNVTIKVGSNIFQGLGNLITVDDEPLLSLSLSNGIIEISTKIYDEGDNLLLEIKKNEWISGDPVSWDIDARYQTIKIRNKQKDIRLDINAKESPIIFHGNLWRKKQNFQIDPNGILLNKKSSNISMRGNFLQGYDLYLDTVQQNFSIRKNV